MGGILDRPVRADGRGGACGGEWSIRDVEGRLGRVAQQPGCGIAGVDVTLDTDDGGDVRLPAGSTSLPAGSKTATVRRSSRLRPLSRLQTDPGGAVLAESCCIC